MKEQSHASEEPASNTPKAVASDTPDKEVASDTPEKMTLADGAKISAVGFGFELAIFLIGAALFGAAYSVDLHVVAAIIFVPVAFLIYKWVKGR